LKMETAHNQTLAQLAEIDPNNLRARRATEHAAN
ncbi:MAG: hypothetical protein RIS70_1793, partial [Planctomycetota bacterium]